MSEYRKRPVVVEAVPCRQLIHAFARDWKALPDWAADAYENGVIVAISEQHGGHLTIKTLEGDHLARAGDMVIRGVAGEIYPCKPDIFAATYEQVKSDA